MNFNARDPAVALQFIVVHYTDMESGGAALQRMCDPAAQVSAHYMIEEDGRVFALVDESQRAWHAGKSFWRGITDLNSASIGIELVNPGHSGGYRAFPTVQIAALKLLMHELIKRHNLSPTHAPLAHSDIAPGRKQDPGELFPWQKLAQDGLGLWPVPQAEDYDDVEGDEVKDLLRRIGYDVSSPAALLAFQGHYHPKNLTGTPEPETVARLRALARVMASR